MKEPIERRQFLASAGLLGAVAAIKGEEHELETLDEAQVLRVQSGDILVFTVAGPMSMDGVERLKDTINEKMKPHLPPGVECMVMTEGMKVGILRPETT